jgi:hypothetical protein
VYAVAEGFLPPGRPYQRLAGKLSLERGLALGTALVLFGVIAAIASLFRWGESDFGDLDPTQTIRTVVPAMLGLVLGMQTIFSSLFVSILAIRRTTPTPAVTDSTPTPSR